jgi:hypothetical protein
MKKIILVMLLLVIIIASGCLPNTETNKQVSDLKYAPADIKGEVQEINEIGNSILIDSTAEIVKGLIWIRINDETYFFEYKDNEIEYKNVSRDFAVGNYVEIVIDGAIAESYPMQAKAGAVYMNETK